MKREREKHITRLHIILFFIVLIAGLTTFIIVRHKLNNSTVIYKDFEEEIVAASINYYQINSIELEEGYEKKVNINKLYEEGLISNDELMGKCKGYSLIANEGSFSSDEDEITHTAYIKCGNKYTTSGYDQY